MIDCDENILFHCLCNKCEKLFMCYSLLYVSCIVAIVIDIVFIDYQNPQTKKVTSAHPPLFIHP